MCFRPATVMTQPNRCPECGKMNKPKVAECVECGALLPHGDTRIECPLCGFKNPSDAKECSSCGATEKEIMQAMKSGHKPPGAPMRPAPPGAPRPPGAPGAPGMPKVPGAPAPPSPNHPPSAPGSGN